jgi:uncharacterized protein with HEPN domain
MDADQVGRLRDILDAARRICSYVAGADENGFRGDTQKQDAIIRRIEIIGEATLHLSDDTRQAIPQLRFRRMRGMPNYTSVRIRQTSVSRDGGASWSELKRDETLIEPAPPRTQGSGLRADPVQPVCCGQIERVSNQCRA